jgi:pyrrolidone-carboxylate peptidase
MLARPRCRVSIVIGLVAVFGAGCGDSQSSRDSGDVVVITDTEEAWAQYEANVSFALSYEARCLPEADSARPRVLVTGYGRFGSNPSNATGLTVSELLPELTYPMTEQPPPGEVDDPAAQTAVALGTIDLPSSGPTDVCAIVLPVYWDLAAVLALAEIEAFNPDFVLMNGIAGPKQPLWIELGSINEAMAVTDGSKVLAPEGGAPLIPTAPDEDLLRGLRLSWETVRSAARTAVDDRAGALEAEAPLSDILHGAVFAGYPRASNTYLCNNVAYTVGYLLDHPGQSFRLLEPSHPREGKPTGIDVMLSADHTTTPRVFVHWPSELSGAHLSSAAQIMAAMMDAQLHALATGQDDPTTGSNDLAEIAGSSGDTF